MTRNILTALLFVFILSACGSNVETIPTSTPIPTLQATSTFTLEPIVTNTPIPTPTPFQYTSCVHPELMNEVKDNAIKLLGMSFEDYITKLLQEGKFFRQDPWSPRGSTYPKLVFVGSAEVSIAGLKGASEGDMLFCAYLVNDEDVETLIPTIVAYTKNGNFYQITDINERIKGKLQREDMTSMEDIEGWFTGSNGVRVGDVLIGAYQSFSGVNSINEVADLEWDKHFFAKETATLMNMLPNDYLERNTIRRFLIETAQALSFEDGDIGIIGSTLQLER